MIQHQRLARISAHLGQHDSLSVEEAVPMLDASPATIRRDFNVLVGSGMAQRTHGGVTRSADSLRGMIPFSAREMTNGAEKAAIARAAAALVDPGDVIVVDGGTSTYHLAAFLGGLAVRVVTNSLRLAAALGDLQHASSQVEVHLTGGHLYPKSGLLIGPLARTGIALYHARFAFLSVGGIDAQGASNTNDLVVDVERAMMDAAERVVVLADHSKIGARSMCHLAGLERVGLLITDRHPASRDILARIRERGVEVNEVDASEPRKNSKSGS